MADVVELAKELNFDVDKFKADIDSSATVYEINKEVFDGNELGIDATPTMYINGDKIVGVKPYYELKELMIKYGAKRK